MTAPPRLLSARRRTRRSTTVTADITSVLTRDGVTLDDAAKIAAEVREPDGSAWITIRNGRLYVARDSDAGLASAIIREAANGRRDRAVEAADTALADAETAFRRALRTTDEPRKLRALEAATEAVVALCDAKQAAGQFSPTHADSIRSEARQQYADALRSIQATARRGIRACRKHR